MDDKSLIYYNSGTYLLSKSLLSIKTFQESSESKDNVALKEKKFSFLKEVDHYPEQIVKHYRRNEGKNSETHGLQKEEILSVSDVFYPKPKTFPGIYSSFPSHRTESHNVSHSFLNVVTMDITDKNQPIIKPKYVSLTNLPILSSERNDNSKYTRNNITSLIFSNNLSLDSIVQQSFPVLYKSPCSKEKLLDMRCPYPMRSSLFPNVPPYLVFITSDEKAMKPPPEIRKLLYWKISELTPTIVAEIAKNSGFTLTEHEHLWLSTWGRQGTLQEFYQFKENQKVNHFPGTFHLGRKDRLWLNIMSMQKTYGKDKFSFMPQTFLLPKNMEELRTVWFEAGFQSRWIIKPPASARGAGIKIVQRWSDIPKMDRVIVQRYISQPYLINGTKFDLRLYILVTSFEPLRLYVYEDGLVRFASKKYSTSFRHIGENFIHLTNYSINCTNLQYTNNEDVKLPQGHKWSLKCLWSYLYKNGVDDKKVWSSLLDVVIKTIISCEEPIERMVKLYAKNRYCCYELFGFDIMLDHSLKPWLLEVNISPSLHTNSQLDLKIKSELVKDMLNIIGLHLPEVQLSKCSQLKMFNRTGIAPQNIYSWSKYLYTFDLNDKDIAKQRKFRKGILNHSSILKTLTPADVKQLIHSEDELARCGHFVRIFPTKSSSLYLPFFGRQKYYNILLNAWENKYHENRRRGIEILQQFCYKGIHIQSTEKENTDEKKQRSPLPKRNSNTSNSKHKFPILPNQIHPNEKKKEITKKLDEKNAKVSFLPSIKNKRENCQFKRQETVSHYCDIE